MPRLTARAMPRRWSAVCFQTKPVGGLKAFSASSARLFTASSVP